MWLISGLLWFLWWMGQDKSKYESTTTVYYGYFDGMEEE